MSGGFLRFIKPFSICLFFNNVRSHEHKIVCGMPQGSVLGLILFNIYIIDIVHAPDKFKFTLLAEDTNILYSSRNYKFVENSER